MKKLLMITCIAMFAMIACKKDNPIPQPPPVKLPEVIITATDNVQILDSGYFIAKLNETAANDVTIKIMYTEPGSLIIDDDEIKIVKGATSGNVAFGGKYVGTTIVSFTSSDAIVKTSKLSVTILPIED